ncbi:acetyl-CoA C-acyltransferase [Pseudomonas sp. C27(2019)]|uniref:beta-ketothiolase BktB n=1 Tax=Pseudomonas sp. C27(2019) TaxID=2604941 RepID=UPI001243D33A|nr:beta-ketothiolase BktB [Pseudomonas sp. C27(2019)]QEY59065.1 acetyl-CoA C-acyltransferase [Pseudomonas sp. C27(2019)]
MKFNSVVIVEGVRTAIGSFGGSLSALSPAAMGTATAQEVIKRSGVDAKQIDHAVYGHIITTAAQDAYLARHIAINAGLDASSAAFNVNRLCGSGLQAIISAAQMIEAGDSTLALAGGAESMSQGAYILPKVRSGLRMGHSTAQDLTLGILSDPFGTGHMGVTAENIAEKYGFTRQQLDEFALASHQKAAAAIENGRFVEQIVPVMVKKGREDVLFASDEHVRGQVSLAELAKLKPAFKKEGLVTAGNASGINDGAASLLLADADTAAQQGLKVRAHLVASAFCGVDPSFMGMGPVGAVTKALQQAGLSVTDMDVIESNEAFAAQAMAVAQELGFASERLNPNGGAVGMGHPVGATGSILTVKALYELERCQGRYALITLCIGGGQGIALIIERAGEERYEP